MKAQAIKLTTLFAALFLVSGVARAEGDLLAAYVPRADEAPAPLACVDLPGDLIQAAASAGIPINQGQIVTATSETITAAATSIAGFEQIPATRFPQGVNVGFVFLNAPSLGIPAGYYRLNATANAQDIRVGSYGGAVGFFSPSGAQVARLPATFETTSLSVPSPLPFPRTQVSLRIDTEQITGAAQRRSYLVIIIHCPNGTTIVIVIGRA